MDNRGAENTLTITKNHWCVPSEARAFDGWIEGKPTEQQKQAALEAARIARAAWKPCEEAFALVEQFRVFVGSRIQVQFWDPIMFMLEDEGPYPTQADLVRVTLREDEGFLQAYLELANLTEIPNQDGYSAAGFFGKSDPDGHYLASLADIYRISRITSSGSVTRSCVSSGRTK